MKLIIDNYTEVGYPRLAIGGNSHGVFILHGLTQTPAGHNRVITTYSQFSSEL